MLDLPEPTQSEEQAAQELSGYDPVQDDYDPTSEQARQVYEIGRGVSAESRDDLEKP